MRRKQGKFDTFTRLEVIEWVRRQPRTRQFRYRDVYLEIGFGYAVVQLALLEMERAGYVTAERPNSKTTLFSRNRRILSVDNVLKEMIGTRNRCPHCGRLLSGRKP